MPGTSIDATRTKFSVATRPGAGTRLEIEVCEPASDARATPAEGEWSNEIPCGPNQERAWVSRIRLSGRTMMLLLRSFSPIGQGPPDQIRAVSGGE